MLKRLATTVAMTLTLGASLGAQMKYASRSDFRATGGTDPMSKVMAGNLGQMAPPGGVDQVVYQSDLGTRTETKQAVSGAPAGAVVITKRDGSKIGFDPAAKTFWKVPPASVSALGGKAVVDVHKAAQPETVSGYKCERVIVSILIPLPGVDPSAIPPGMPSSLPLTLTAWFTDEVKMPNSQSSLDLGALQSVGGTALKQLADDGRFVVKTLIRGFGIEIETTNSDVTPATVTPEMFAVPAGYREILPPGRGGTIALTRSPVSR